MHRLMLYLLQLASMSDDKTVVKAPTSCPPQDPKDQPKPCACTSGPTL